MFEKYDENRLNKDIAFLSIKEIIKHKLLYNGKTHQVGLFLSGSFEDNYLFPLEKINLKMIRYIDSLNKELTKYEQTTSFYEDLNTAVNLLSEIGKKYKGKKKIFIFTSADFEKDMDNSEIEDIIKEITLKDIYVNIISFDFWGVEKNKLTNNQILNKDIFKMMVKKSNFKIFSSSLTLLIHRQFKKKDINIRANFVGKLEITPQILLDINIYFKTKQEKTTTIKKYNSSLPFDIKCNTQRVKREIYYYDENEIDKDQLIKGYNYGDQLIPISKEIENKIKFQKEDKNLKIICFVKENEIPRHYYLSEVEVIYPKGDLNNILSFNSIVRSCIENYKLGLAKYIKKKNAPPKFVVLHPYYKNKCFCFYLIELPTIEDMREYNFKSLKISDELQRKSIRNFIKKMDLMNVKKNNEIVEEVNPNKMFNPEIQYFNQCILHKIENKNRGIPEINPEFINQYKINEMLLQDCDEEFQEMKKNLNLIKNEDYIEEKKERIYWKTLLEDYEKNAETLQAELINNKLNKDEENFVKCISIKHPLSDFKEMMNNKKEDLVEDAIKQMIFIIKKLIEESYNKNNFDKSIECIKYLRDGCIFEEEFELFNNFLLEIKSNNSPNFNLFFKELILRKISLISNKECENCKITERQSQEFINMQIENDTLKQKDNDDEIFDEIE